MTVIDPAEGRLDIAASRHLPSGLRAAAECAKAFVDTVAAEFRLRSATIDRDSQHVLHGLAWYASYAAAMGAVAEWATRLQAENRFGEVETLLSRLLFSEYAAQLAGGIAMNQGEAVRPGDLTADRSTLTLLHRDGLAQFQQGARQDLKSRIVEIIGAGRLSPIVEDPGLDETLDIVRREFRAFADDKVSPFAQGWHVDDRLIPIELVTELGRLGVFGLTIAEPYGGLGMGKTAMCVVSEELSRASLAVGSLATRSEIAGDLILSGGSEEQKRTWLPRIASGEMLPAAAFTEPGSGSDLGSIRTRAVREGDSYLVHGAKTWVTHAARADLLTLLVRTDPESSDHRGLSMLLAPKPRGTQDDPFPAPGLRGGELPVIGYRGMKEYEIAFDGFEVPAENLLGGVAGQGFRQLMATFESARIQTAARAIGVAQAALEVGLGYAAQREQFGRPIVDFPRVCNKLAMIAAELVAVRQLTYTAAKRKDGGARCDLEAGMAKLLAARVAWAAADNALQIHGGNGFAVESEASRLLADARILNIFEGAGEIQAEVIARRLMEERNIR